MKKRNLSFPLSESNIPDSSGNRDNKYNPTDPPKGKRSKTARVYGLPGQSVYTQDTPIKVGRKFGDIKTMPKGTVVAPGANRHTDTGIVRRSHGQVSRAKDPTKRGSKGSVRGKSTK